MCIHRGSVRDGQMCGGSVLTNHELVEITTPVVFITYIRLDTTKQTFEQIRKAKPRKLYYISDGGKDELGQQKVEIVRKYVEEHIDWPCELHTNYADVNMGAGKRIQSGLNWVFEKEDRAIIIEDDVWADVSYFQFAQEMLEKYKDEKRIHAVTSNCRGPKEVYQYSYSFSRFSSIWGWATWRRAWCGHDMDASNWPKIKKSKLLRKEFSLGVALYYEREIESVCRGENDAWDIQWFLARAISKSYEIEPNIDLAVNIGNTLGEGETHKPIRYVHGDIGEMHFPLNHPPKVEANLELDKYINSRYPLGFIEKMIRLTVPASWLRSMRLLLTKIRGHK